MPTLNSLNNCVSKYDTNLKEIDVHLVLISSNHKDNNVYVGLQLTNYRETEPILIYNN